MIDVDMGAGTILDDDNPLWINVSGAAVTAERAATFIASLSNPHEDVATAHTLVPPPSQGSRRGKYAKICVTNFNEGGRLDLVIGDLGEGFLKELSEEEKQWREEVRGQQTALLQLWADVFRQYRKLLGAPQPEQAGQRREQQQELQSLRERLQQLNRVRETFSRKEQALEPGKQYHGRVWLLLRK